MLPARRKSKGRYGTRKADGPLRSAAHLQWLRLHYICAAWFDMSCSGKVEAAHVRTGTDGSMGQKPSDIWVVPLCHKHHAEQHQIGEAEFERRYGVKLKAMAEDISRKSPALARLRGRP